MPDDCIRVPLTQGKFTTIDAADAERILAYKWCLHKSGYAYRGRRKSDGSGPHCIMLHWSIIDVPDGMLPDHIDRDKLNNRRSNLRLVSNAGNKMNVAIRADNTSGFRGVSWDKRSGKWEAHITVESRKRFLGYFNNAEDAARARDAEAFRLYGPVAFLNLPMTET